MQTTQQYDVVIIGAGPAGSTCALALKGSGLKVALLDRAEFPRDKVCGDAIPGRAVKTLQQIDPAYVDTFDRLPKKCFTKRTVFHVNDKRNVQINWVNKAYTCARIDFDEQLFELVQDHAEVDIYQKCALKNIIREADGLRLECTQNRTFKARMIIGCDGAHSIVNKQLTDYKVDLAHYGGAVRAYYSNVEGMETDCTEVYMQKKWLPGYFWLFPLPNNRANAGFGMLSKHISDHKINLRSAFKEFIDSSPLLQERLKNSQLEGKIMGFGLPFGSQKVQVSGERFLLTGDAASLIDPSTGDGIGNAMVSGKTAADQIKKCFQQQCFDADYMKSYDQLLYAQLWDELRTRTKVQRAVSRFPWLLDLGMILGNTPGIKDVLRKFA